MIKKRLARFFILGVSLSLLKNFNSYSIDEYFHKAACEKKIIMKIPIFINNLYTCLNLFTLASYI